MQEREEDLKISVKRFMYLYSYHFIDLKQFISLLNDLCSCAEKKLKYRMNLVSVVNNATCIHIN